jgi:anti-sigma factor RsiW
MDQVTRIDDVMLMAYVDGEVDAATAREIEAATAADPILGRRVAMFRQTASLARGAFTDVLHEPVPEHLVALLRDPALKADDADARAGAGIVTLAPRAARPLRTGGGLRSAAWAAAAAILAVAVFAAGTRTGWIRFADPPATQLLASGADSERWVDNLAAWYRVHLASFEKDQRLLVDIGADDIGELEAWIGAKLQRRISVPDLAAYGFRQQGGRLLLIGGKPAAQFFYEGEKRELVQLVVGVTDQPDRSGRLDTRDGINVVSWRERGYAYAFIGRLDGQKLWQMADTTWAKLKPI